MNNELLRTSCFELARLVMKQNCILTFFKKVTAKQVSEGVIINKKNWTGWELDKVVNTIRSPCHHMYG